METFIIYWTIIAGLVLLIFRAPAVAAGGLLCTFGLEQWAQATSEWFYVHQSLTNYVTASLAVFALTIRFIRGEATIFPISRECWCIIAILTWACASFIWSIAPGETFRIVQKNAPYILIFGFALPFLVRNLDDLRASLLLLITVGGLLCVLLLTTVDWRDRTITMTYGSSVGSVIGDRGNPLAVASLAGHVCLAAVLMPIRRVPGLGSALSLLLRWGLVATCIILSIRTGSRGQSVALGIAALVFIPLSRNVKNIPGFFGMVVSAGLFFGLAYFIFPQVQQTNVWTREGFWDAWTTGRYNTSMILLDRWATEGPIHWVLGLGSSASFRPDICGFYPHVVFFEVLGELGLIGFVLLWLIPIAVLRSVIYLWPRVVDDAVDRGTAAAVGAMFLFEMILSFKQGSLLGSYLAFAFAIIIGRMYLSVKSEIEAYQEMDDTEHRIASEYELYENEPESQLAATGTGSTDRF